MKQLKLSSQIHPVRRYGETRLSAVTAVGWAGEIGLHCTACPS